MSEEINEIKAIRKALSMTQKEFAAEFKIPFRTVQNWEGGVNTPPPYLVELLKEVLRLKYNIDIKDN